MRDYLTTGRAGSKRPRSPFRSGNLNFDTDNESVYSWVDIFLRDDVHIVGYSLDYSEIDLWWLIIHKERLRIDGEPTGDTFFYRLAPRLGSGNRAKAALLRSFGVKVVDDYRTNSYDAGYDAFNQGRQIRHILMRTVESG